MTRTASNRFSVLGLVLGAVALLLLARKAGPEDVLTALRVVGPSALLLLVPYLLATTLYAVPWGLLLSRAQRPRWAAIVGTRFAAAAVNVVLPSGFFGEPVRLRAVAPESRGAAGEALVWDRALYLVASAGFLAIAALAALGMPGGPAVTAAAGVAVLGYVVGGASLVGISQIALFRRWIGRHLAKRWPTLAHPRPALRPGVGWALAGFSLHLVARLVVATEVWLAARLLGVPLGLDGWLFTAGAMALSAAAMPMVPGQIGVQEAALVGALAALGVPPATGLALALLLRVRQLLFVPVGLALATSTLTAYRAAPAGRTAPEEPGVTSAP